jgi:hypothetical protein
MSKTIQLTSGPAIFTMPAMGAISHRGNIVCGESEQWPGHTDQVLENIQGLLLSIESTESDYQAFALADRDCSRGAA